jgi:hypothetical protein
VVGVDVVDVALIGLAPGEPLIGVDAVIGVVPELPLMGVLIGMVGLAPIGESPVGVVPMGVVPIGIIGEAPGMGIAAGVPGVLATGLGPFPPPQPAIATLSATSRTRASRCDMQHLAPKTFPPLPLPIMGAFAASVEKRSGLSAEIAQPRNQRFRGAQVRRERHMMHVAHPHQRRNVRLVRLRRQGIAKEKDGPDNSLSDAPPDDQVAAVRPVCHAFHLQPRFRGNQPPRAARRHQVATGKHLAVLPDKIQQRLLQVVVSD